MQDAQSSLTQAIQILTDFYAKAGEGNDHTQQSPSSRFMWSQVYNRNQVGCTNVFSSLQVIQSDFARLESETTEAESEAGRIFDEFTGKTVEGVWDSVKADAYGSHIRDTSEFAQQWCRITRIHFTKWLGRHNSSLPVL